MAVGCSRFNRRLAWNLWTVLLTTLMTVSGAAADENQQASLSSLALQGPFPLEIEILTQPQPGYGIKAQEWGREFQQTRFVPRFREARRGERMRVENIDSRDRRVVHVVGGLDRDGTISIGDQKFRITEMEQLKALLEEYARWGASGPLKERPHWGLDEEQLRTMMNQLNAPVGRPVELQSALTAADSIELPAQFRLTFTPAARARLAEFPPDPNAGSIEMNGLSKGTALALALAQFGLGFRPIMAPNGQVELQVDTGTEASNLWPIGWTSQESITTVVPSYSRNIDIDDLDNVAVTGLLQIIAERMKVPHYYSANELQAAGIDVESLTYSRKKSSISPFRLLTLVAATHKMGIDLRVDEAGKPFLWVTTSKESMAFRHRFARPIE
ncbi:MAG: hypothetical protein KDA85_06675 [Planctomycetaceae bacterium]|nr:hypothetical protein [Planctomycetaceae bacterium]